MNCTLTQSFRVIRFYTDFLPDLSVEVHDKVKAVEKNSDLKVFWSSFVIIINALI